MCALGVSVSTGLFHSWAAIKDYSSLIILFIIFLDWSINSFVQKMSENVKTCAKYPKAQGGIVLLLVLSDQNS